MTGIVDLGAVLGQGPNITPAGGWNWRDDARCTETGPDLFFPEVWQSAEPAKRICATCPVRPECFTWAMTHYEKGVWGGTSDKQRAAIRSGHRPPPDWAADGTVAA